MTHSVAINKAAKQQGGSPTFIRSTLHEGEYYALYSMPNGSEVIDTNGEPIFEDEDQVAFHVAKVNIFGEREEE